MKKQITLLTATLMLTVNINAQNPNSNANAKWGISGNSTATTDFMGTTNNQPLILKTNNVQRALFDTQGKLMLDGGGEVIINSGGLNRPISTNPISAYMLKVGGSGHFDGEVNTKQLFVKEYITYLKSLKGPSINVDSIRMDSTRGIYGHTKIFGDVQIKQNLVVDGNATFKGNLTAEKGLMFDGIKGLHYTAATATSGAVYKLGNDPSTDPSEPVYCFLPNTNSWFNLQGGFISRAYPSSGNSVNSSLTMASAPWDGSGIIEVEGTDATGGTTNGLLINYFCHRNTNINTGWNLPNGVDGGTVFMGAKVVMQNSLRIGWSQSGTVDLNTSIDINQSVANGNGVKVNTYNNGLKAFTIKNTNFTNSPFTVFGDGKTQINATVKANKYFTVVDNSNAPAPVESFVVYGDGKTSIGDSYVPTGYQLSVKGKIIAEEVVVQLRNN